MYEYAVKDRQAGSNDIRKDQPEFNLDFEIKKKKSFQYFQ